MYNYAQFLRFSACAKNSAPRFAVHSMKLKFVLLTFFTLNFPTTVLVTYMQIECQSLMCISNLAVLLMYSFISRTGEATTAK